MKDTKAILTEAYPVIEAGLKKNGNKYKKYISNYINKNADLLYSSIPSKQIYFSQTDCDEYFKAIDVNDDIVKRAISHTYYADISNFNPRYAKDETTIALMCTIRYYLLHNMKKELELALINTAFSGKYYPSIWHGSFPVTAPSEHVMEYAISHLATNKFEIVREGNVIGAVKSIATTWVESYRSKFKDFHDDDVVYVVQQLHNRLRSFMNNIAELYYDAYENKSAYMTYDSDDVSEDNYHLVGSDSMVIDKYVANTINYINNHGINYKICKLASNDLVKFDELKGIIDMLTRDNKNLPLLKEFITLLLVNYYIDSGKKNIEDIEFISYSISPKPNSKNGYHLRQKEISEKLLINNAANFSRRRSRNATESAYFRAFNAYFALLVQEAN
jgi:hypothetical protein